MWRGPSYDLAIIGGGINGCGIARDAAGRGLSVFLCEKGDLAGATSSASTKLIHGGLRYLEYLRVPAGARSADRARGAARAAPHIIWPLRFVLPHHKGLRPAWLHPARPLPLRPPRRPQASCRRRGSSISPRSRRRGRCKPEYRRAFEYSDCWVEDCAAGRPQRHRRGRARRRASSRAPRCVGASAQARLARHAERHEERRRAQRDRRARPRQRRRALGRRDCSAASSGVNAPAQMRLVKGSHIVVRRLFEHDRAYIFQNADGRIVFAIPYEHDFTLIGTTDLDFTGDPADAAISDDETSYLCAAVSEYFREPVQPSGSCGPMPACARSMTTAQANARRDARLRAEARRGSGDARRSSTAMAARSPPTAAWRSASWRCSPATFRDAGAGLDGECGPSRRRFSGGRHRG